MPGSCATLQLPCRRLDAGALPCELSLPEAGPGPWPCVVILTSSAGVCDTRERFYARHFAARGLAALVVDSFAPRGIRETTTDQSQLPDQDLERDAYAAHDYLAADPRFDPGRIAVMGVSKGGLAALNTALLVRRRWFARPERDFCARAALVPPAHMQQRDARTDGRPLLMILAELDDYTGVAAARAYAERMIAAGNPRILVEVEPGARHAFERIGPPLFLAQAENYMRQLFFIEDDGSLAHQPDGERMSQEEFFRNGRRFRTLGGHAGGGTPQLRERVADRLLEFLAADHGQRPQPCNPKGS